MPTRSHPILRRSSAALGGAVVAAGVLVAVPGALPELAPERVLLSPTADPSTSQTVTWRAGTAGEPALQIAPDHNTSDRVTTVQAQQTGQAGGTYYAATATDLQPDTTHRYRVGDLQGEFSDWSEFTTAADATEPFRFLHFGDIQDDITEGAAPVVRAALEAEPEAELAVHSGDLIDEADNDDEWTEWFEAFGPRATAGINHLATPGNHEYANLSLSEHWVPQFPGAGNGPAGGGRDLAETVYYTDYQGVRLVVLNSNYRDADPVSPTGWLEQQRDWLEQVLADNPQDWTVVTFHHPLFSSNPGRDNAPLRRAWLHTLEEFDVDLVLTGHDHSYSRGNLTEHRTTDPDVHTGPVYAVAVTGPKMYEAQEDNWTDNDAEARVQHTHTQTFQTVSVDGNTLQYLARTADGDTVDAFTIVKDQEGKRVTDTL